MKCKSKNTKIEIRICECCIQQFEVLEKRKSKTCSKKCMYELRSKKLQRVVACKCCGEDFTTSSRNAEFCSSRCLTRYNNESKYVSKTEGYDYIKCPVCGQKMAEISHGHAQMHGHTKQSLKETYNLDTTKCEKLIENMKGENNPAYNHGGKFSPWSKNFIHGYDEEKHEEFKQLHSERQTNSETNQFSYAYWLKQADGDEVLASEMYTKSQTRDLDWFIGKYGEVEGTKRHNNKTKKWLGTMNSKSPEELADINSRKIKKNSAFYSKAEKELFEVLKTKMPEITDQHAICRNPLERDKKFYLYDMMCNNKIIEYNGDFWHANPSIYDNTFVCPYTKRTFNEIHKKDKDKIKLAELSGFSVLTIWEHDYKNNKEKVIEECLNFLMK